MSDSDIPKQPEPPDECPITTLIGPRITHMSDAELEEFSRNMRTVVDSPQELRKRISFANVKSPRKPTQPKIDIANLLGL